MPRKTAPNLTPAMMNIGCNDMKEASAPLADAICKIMAASGDQKTVRAALAAFSHSVAVSDITVRDCTFESRPAEPAGA